MRGRPETLAWLERYYGLIDAGRVREAMDEYLTADCTFLVAHRPPAGFADEARRLRDVVAAVRHRVLGVLEDGDGALACELEVTYERHDGTSVTLPGALFATVADGRFVEQRAYIDQGPLAG